MFYVTVTTLMDSSLSGIIVHYNFLGCNRWRCATITIPIKAAISNDKALAPRSM